MTNKVPQVGEVWRNTVNAWDGLSKWNGPDYFDNSEETARIIRVWINNPVMILSVTFKAGEMFTETDPDELHDRYEISFLYKNAIWYSCLTVRQFNDWFERLA